MALQTTFDKTEFGVGDSVRVVQKVQEGEKQRLQAFEGVVIKIKGEGSTKTFTVRRVGAQKVGIERIFPLNAPSLDSIEVIREGKRGSRRAKLYYIRDKSSREVEKIYSSATRRQKAKDASKKKTTKKKTAKKSSSKSSKK